MSESHPAVVIHGHFYQPPREDPWTDAVPVEPSAAPFHDWNERIERECYRAVVAARVYAPDGRIARIVNTLAAISYDAGPTLLDWMERAAPATYAAFLDGDRLSRARHGGHGNAIAMPYHHIILPLATRRDKVSEVRWGIADFRKRFGREPEGLWLPETAVDAETLDVLAAEGIRFTVLAPHQVKHAPRGGLPGRYRTASGRAIALFIYDGEISHGVAFGDFLKNGNAWAERLLKSKGRLVSVATDGETYGHHQKFGEVALAWVLDELGRRGVAVENYASFLARHPAEQDVELVEPTSWSCAHGVERWRSDCGCKMAPEKPSQQAWRAPLRQGLDWLAAELRTVFERDGTIAEHERDILRMFTSCGWFFDDIAGIEALQILRYAAYAIERAGPDAGRLEAGLLDYLARARSNNEAAGSGRRVYVTAFTGAALLRAVRALERDQSSATVARVAELAGLLTGEQRPIPFDVQTEFYAMRDKAPALARALGFSN